MKRYILMVFAALALLTSCSSNSIKTSHYYLLYSPSLAPTNTVDITVPLEQRKKTTLVINELPSYLNQPNVVMQLSDHQLHYALYHIWAEPIALSIEKALLSDLNARVSDTYFVHASRQKINHELPKLTIEIDGFQANHHGEVLLSGKFLMAGAVNTFNIKVVLEQDGYAHSVKQMRLALTRLSELITARLGS